MTKSDQSDDRDRREAEGAEEQLRDIGYRPNVNQVRHEPIPASDHAERGQLGEMRNEEAARAAAAHEHERHKGNDPDGSDEVPGR